MHWLECEGNQGQRHQKEQITESCRIDFQTQNEVLVIIRSTASICLGHCARNFKSDASSVPSKLGGVMAG